MAKNSGLLPGLDYLERVGRAWLTAATDQVLVVSNAWSQIKEKKYGYRDALSDWATAVDDYYEAAVEASRGPSYVWQPIWIVFTHKKGQNEPVLKRTEMIDRYESAATELDYTPFTQMDRNSDSVSKDDAYEAATGWSDRSHRSITVELNKKAWDKAAAGTYISFIFAAGRGPEKPLVIVVLRLTDAKPSK
jgi:hypothetical protein